MINKLGFTDLHTHSTFSDGTDSPETIVEKAKKAGLSSVALTDHDCVYGIDQFVAAGKKHGIETISGIELASYFSAPFIERTKEIHIVGLFIDSGNSALLDKTRQILNDRVERNKKMTKRLTELGFPMTYDELREVAGGYVKDKKEAFAKYISSGMPGYVPRILPTPKECIELIKNAGGVPVLAHSTLYGLTFEQIDLMAESLRKIGMEAMEVMYSTYTAEQEAKVTAIAKKHGYAFSGGSDYHGLNKAGIYIGIGKGNLKIPESFVYDLKLRRGN